MHPEVKVALKSLPWYLVGTFLFLPLILAPFTFGGSLMLYVIGPGGLFTGKHSDFVWSCIVLSVPGLLVWVLRQFFRAAVFSWKKNHLVRY